MFKSLLKNLPFNPSLIEHIPAHIRLIKRERKIRILGLVVFIAAIAVQLSIAIHPAQSTLSSSPNDLVSGGFDNPLEAASDCLNNINGYKNVLSHYHITCSDVSAASTAQIKSDDNNGELYSLNRLGYGKPNEESITINGETYWQRPLNTWTKTGSTTYGVLSGKSETGNTFYLMYGSGDVVLSGTPTPTSLNCDSTSAIACAKQSISVRNDTQSISNANNTTAMPSDQLIYTMAATNPTTTLLSNYRMAVNFSDVLTYTKLVNAYGGSLSHGIISWPAQVLGKSNTITHEVVFNVTKPLPNTPISATDPGRYNLHMVSIFGNVVQVNLPWSFSKFSEVVLNNGLPYMSSVTSLVVAVIVALGMVYFILRKNLLISEMHSLKDEYLNNDKD